MKNKMMFFMVLAFLGMITILTMLEGCKTVNPPPSSKISETIDIPQSYAEIMTDQEASTGIRRGWINYDGIKNYDKVMINVLIDTNKIQNSPWEQISGRRLVASLDEDYKYLADYTQDSLIKAFQKSKYFTPVNESDPNTLKIRFIIVQVVANKPVLGALSNCFYPSPIGWIAIPIKLRMENKSPNTGGAIAMETIISNSETEQIEAVFAAREKGPTSVFDAKKFVSYGNIRHIIDMWATNIVSTLDQIKEGKRDLEAAETVEAFTPISF